MMAFVMSLDPGSDYLGLSLVHTTNSTGFNVVESVSLRCLGNDAEAFFATAEQRVSPVVSQWLLDWRIDVCAVERPPGTARGDTRHAKQANIGWWLGLYSGLVFGLLRGTDTRFAFVPVSDWRKTMLVECARAGLVLERPGRARRRQLPTDPGRNMIAGVQRDGPAFVVRFKGCTHTARVDSIGALHTVSACPVCSAPTPTPTTPEEIRDEWKRLSCAASAHFAPDIMRELETSARARAKIRNKPIHQLAGVADASDSIWVGVHAARSLP